MSWRDVMCGEPRPEHVGADADACGLGRDAGATTAASSSSTCATTRASHSSSSTPSARPTAAEAAKEIRNEFVLRARGEVVARAPETVNAAMPTGAVELQVDELEIVSRSTPLPFQLDEEGVDETLRLRYRWLDMRTPRMQRNLRLAHTVDLVDPPDDGRPRLHRRVDAEHDARHAGGRARLRRAGAPPAGPLLRAGAVARRSSSSSA